MRIINFRVQALCLLGAMAVMMVVDAQTFSPLRGLLTRPLECYDADNVFRGEFDPSQSSCGPDGIVIGE